ncbi:hypothetical protein Forpe1208_v014214 [Fusarium oxysporum f. sp. rapae]|uniref:Uncharacterized protein n=1 Tax=Fusarium oxysporum f. sp. rapae TaxID=485398 RepID=A0A8J5NHA1_FUSOX|nr:hypothetical protein Forpe1208_v014214 [Fusarium oxysporum f. sp. rapae]
MLARIRAIYIPIAFAASEDHPHLSMWLQVSFTQNRVVDIWRGYSTFSGHETDTMIGLRVWRDVTVGFDIRGLTELLSCPRQFRKVNPYQAKFTKLVHRDSIRTVPVADSYSDGYDFSWLTIAQAHSGLNIEWRKGEKGSWFEDFFRNAITFSLSFIPSVSPILSIAFSLRWTAVVNPDRFMYELSLWATALTHESFWNMGPAEALAEIRNLEEEKKKQQKVSGKVQSYFQQAHEVLRVDEAKCDKGAGADEEPGEVLVEVPPREGPTNGHAVGAKE